MNSMYKDMHLIINGLVKYNIKKGMKTANEKTVKRVQGNETVILFFDKYCFPGTI